jgi:hypothetical protein
MDNRGMDYSEVIRPPWWAYGVFAGLAALLCFTFAAVVTVPPALVLYVVACAAGFWLVSRRSLVITVDDEALHVGTEQISLSQVREVTPLDAQGVRSAAGAQVDTRARLVLRNLATPTGVKVDLRSGDIPYWLISSGRPEQLAASINSKRTALGASGDL